MRPGYRLAADDQAALKAYYSQPRPGEGKLSPQARGRDLLVQLNCLACHQREGVDRTGKPRCPPGLQDKLIGRRRGARRPRPARARDDAAGAQQRRRQAARRGAGRLHQPPRPAAPAVPARADAEVQSDATSSLPSLTAYFTATDRIPRGAGVPPAMQDAAGETPAPRPRSPPAPASSPPTAWPARAATRSARSCRRRPRSTPAGRTCRCSTSASAANGSTAGATTRRGSCREWKCPSVKVPVRGVLNEKIDDQLAAVWHILNTPGFEPPEPNPVRVLRLSGVPEKNERPIVIHDVFKDGDKTYLYPLVIGLPNRHNILFDLETNRLAAWWLGDTARQRTKGKSWYWEMGGKSIFDPASATPRSRSGSTAREYRPAATGQFVEPNSDSIASSDRIELPSVRDELAFPAYDSTDGSAGQAAMYNVRAHDLRPRPANAATCSRLARSSLANGTFSMRLASRRCWHCAVQMGCKTRRRLQLPGRCEAIDSRRQSWTNRSRWNGDGTMSIGIDEPAIDQNMPGFIRRFDYTRRRCRSISILRRSAASHAVRSPAHIEIAPGFTAQRLAACRRHHASRHLLGTQTDDLVFCNAKGPGLFAPTIPTATASRTRCSLLADGLATPYGIQCRCRHDRCRSYRCRCQRRIAST